MPCIRHVTRLRPRARKIYRCGLFYRSTRQMASRGRAGSRNYRRSYPERSPLTSYFVCNLQGHRLPRLRNRPHERRKGKLHLDYDYGPFARRICHPRSFKAPKKRIGAYRKHARNRQLARNHRSGGHHGNCPLPRCRPDCLILPAEFYGRSLAPRSTRHLHRHDHHQRGLRSRRSRLPQRNRRRQQAQPFCNDHLHRRNTRRRHPDIRIRPVAVQQPVRRKGLRIHRHQFSHRRHHLFKGNSLRIREPRLIPRPLSLNIIAIFDDGKPLNRLVLYNGACSTMFRSP